MSVPHGTTLKAAVVASRLLESELEFYNILQPSEDTLEFIGGDPDAEDQGQMEIWWTPEIEDRRWGIKGISVHIKKLTLDGWFEKHENGRTRDVGTGFHYEYPEPKETLNIGDADEPSPDNVYRLAKPKWKLSWKISPTPADEFTLYARNAIVDVQKHTIEILF